RGGARYRGVPAARVPIEAASSDLTELEDVGVAGEEVPALREEQIETGQVDLAVVHLGGGKIRVDGERRIELWRHLVEEVELRLHRLLAVPLCAEAPLLPHHEVGDHVEADTLPHSDHAGGGTGNARIHLTIAGDPGDGFIIAADGAAEV